MQYGEGTVLEVNDGASSAFVAIDDIDSITPPKREFPRVPRNRLSVTTMQEVAVSGRRALGELSFSYELGYTGFARLEALANVSKSYRLTFPDGTRFAFTGTMFVNDPDQVTAGAIVMGTAGVALQSLLTITDTTP